jgi:hypothetical protein
MKGAMLKRIPLFFLLVVQVLGGGAIALAHARDAVAAPHTTPVRAPPSSLS